MPNPLGKLTHQQMKQVLRHLAGRDYECPMKPNEHTHLHLIKGNAEYPETVKCQQGCKTGDVIKEIRKRLASSHTPTDEKRSKVKKPKKPYLPFTIKECADGRHIPAEWLIEKWH